MKLTKLVPIVASLLIVFIAGCQKDDEEGIRPTVVSTDPITSSTDRAVNSSISATFSVAMDPASISNSTFTLQKDGASVAGTTTYTGTTASFAPTADLSPNSVYTATITKDVRNMDGRSMSRDYTWTFTTSTKSDFTPPTVTLTDPANSAVGVAVTKVIKVTFSEPMDAATITAFTLAVRRGAASVTGAITYSGTVATFTPANDFEASKIYTVTTTTGVKDVAGNALATEHVVSFTTGVPDTTLPEVSSTVPANNATGVSEAVIVAITFSEAMTASTISTSTVTLFQGATAVAGTVAYTGTTATFTPTASLTSGQVYTATVKTGAKDLAGNALAVNKVWSFTTTGGTSNLSVVDLGAAGNYVILAQTAINNNPISAITGDLGLSPAATSFITGFALTNATGFATATQVTGKLYAADMASPTSTNLTTAVENMITAYNDAAGRPSPDFLELATGNIGGQTLVPGLYKWTSTVTMPTSLSISGGANDVWIFQIAGDLTMAGSVNITLEGGAQAKNIFWQVAGAVTVGTTSHFEGIILSMTGVTFQTGASMNGRVLAQTAVILDANAITESN